MAITVVLLLILGAVFLIGFRDERDRDDDCLAEPDQEHPTENQQQHHGDGHGVALQEARQVGVLQEVHSGVR